MDRTAMAKLIEWKNKRGRKPLIIRGARQVGKTWLMKHFGDQEYAQTVYINFDNNERMERLFSVDLDVHRLVEGLELVAGHTIDPASTLLIFDEVQEVPRALTSLKYFNENAPEYHIICAGSLLGVALHPGTSFPVGKVEFLDLGPLSFLEFMRAGDNARFADPLMNGDIETTRVFKDTYIRMLKSYLYVGGMPEVVAHYSQNNDLLAVREIQERILAAYEQDFSKHAPASIVPRIRMVWKSVPSQLAKENKKFIYGLVKSGARAKDFELALMWLSDCGLIHQVHRATAPRLPLKAYEDLRAFKLFLVDVGLLSCMAGIRPDILLDGSDLFTEFKGALTEQYVYQELLAARDFGIYYWTNDRGTAEVDFLLDTGRSVVPVEAKAGVNLQAKSLKTFREEFGPEISVRTALADYRRDDWLINLPLYSLSMMQRILTDDDRATKAGSRTSSGRTKSP